MAILKNDDGTELILSCECGCDEGIKVKVEKDEDVYCYQTYLSANWYKEQEGIICKIKKIWKILRNKDFYYSEILLSKQDWETYKKWISEH